MEGRIVESERERALKLKQAQQEETLAKVRCLFIKVRSH